MAGVKGRSGGHNRKRTEQLKAEGGIRKHRHENRADVIIPPASVSTPEHLGEAGRELFERIVATLPKSLITKATIESLGMYADLWECYLSLRPQFLANPVDKDIRISYMSVVDRIDKLGRQFGWTPLSLSGIKVPEQPDKDEDVFESLISRMSGNN